jgi:predicted P-loop ATPase
VNQGNGKSTAIETLSPEFSWYDETTRMSFDSKDSLSSLNSAFIYEFSEIEKILTTFDVAQFKSWITRKVDKYVEKYESISKDHPRRCCLFGTTNASTFLMDPTGARRFLICENTRPANIKLLKTLRDAIWKQSLVELENGLPHYLTNDSLLHSEDQKRAENATVSDPWEAELSSFLSNCKHGEFVTSQQLLKHLNKPVDKLDMRDCKRIGNIMKRMKWEKARRRQIYHANPVDGYIKPEPETLTSEQAEEILDA